MLLLQFNLDLSFCYYFCSFLARFFFCTETKSMHCFLSEMKYFEDLTQLLAVQVREMKSLSSNIRNLEGKCSNFIEKRKISS